MSFTSPAPTEPSTLADPRLRIAIDVGGTFTDLVLLHGANKLTTKLC